MDDRDRNLADRLHRASEGWSFDSARSRSIVEARAWNRDRSPSRGVSLIVGLVLGTAVVSGSIVMALGSGDERDGTVQAPGASNPPSPTVSDSTCEGAIAFRPTYLPWRPDEIPAPREGFDSSIDRAQLVWTGQDGTEVALTLYPHAAQGNVGQRTDVLVDGVNGYLHAEDEGGLISMSWDLAGHRCNYLELILSQPDAGKDEATEELLKIASSFRRDA